MCLCTGGLWSGHVWLCVCYLWAAHSRCCTRCVCVQQRHCGGAACPPPASSLSSCSGTEPHRARLLPTAVLLLAAASPSQQTHPVAATHLAAPHTPHLQREREGALTHSTWTQHTTETVDLFEKSLCVVFMYHHQKENLISYVYVNGWTLLLIIRLQKRSVHIIVSVNESIWR